MNARKFLAAGTVAVLSLFGTAAWAQQSEGGAKPSDPQIVGIVSAANQIDIDTAKLALQKTKNDQVKQYAQQMIDDHTKLQKSVDDLAKKLNVKPEPSDTSKSLHTAAATEMKKLRGMSGKAFDKAYIDREVDFHQQVIDTTSKALIPNAQNAELKSALEGAAPLLQGHLEHAKQIQSGMGSSSAAGTHKHHKKA